MRFFCTAFAATAISMLGSAMPARAESPAICHEYARQALIQYQMTDDFHHPQCRVKADGRWQADYQNHYRWCLTAPAAWVKAEKKARNQHLYACGARSYGNVDALSP